MKRVELRILQKYTSKAVFRLVAENSPQRAIGIAEMRKRVKLIDAIEAASGDTLMLEDELHATLKAALEEFPWNVATTEVLTIIDDVIEAKEVSQRPLKTVEN